MISTDRLSEQALLYKSVVEVPQRVLVPRRVLLVLEVVLASWLRSSQHFEVNQ